MRLKTTGTGLERAGSGAGWLAGWKGPACVMAVAVAVGGCATRADLLEVERRMDAQMREQARSLEEVRVELEHLRPSTGGTAGGLPSRAGIPRPMGRKTDKERAATGGKPTPPSPSQEIGMTPVPEGTSTEGGAAGAAVPATPPPAPPPTGSQEPRSSLPPPHPAVEESWKREVEQERAVASTMHVAERSEYMGALARLAKGDCSRAAGRLNAVSTDAKGSPLADNALYWQARCDAARGDQRQAVSRFRDIVTRYPKSDKAPAALWEQGKLLLHSGDTPTARGVLSRLVHDYPSSEEAAQARRALANLEH